MSKTYYKILYLLLFLLVVYDAVYSYLPKYVSTILQWGGMILMAYAIPQYMKTKNKSVLITSSLILLILMLVSYFIVEAKASTFLKTCGFCILAPIPFMVGNISTRSFKRFCFFIVLLSIFTFVITMNRIRVDDDLAFGSGYYALVALPIGYYLLRGKSFLIKILYSAFILALVLYSAKRGDILACLLSIIAFFILSSQQKKKNRYATFILTVLFLGIIGVVLFRYFLNNSIVFQYRYEQTLEGETSGRDIIYAKLWNYFQNSPIDKKIIGYGFDAPQRIIGGSAHNDWLEILLGEGIVGVVLFLIMVLSMVAMVFRKSISIEKRALFGSILAIWLVKSIFSMFLFSMPSVVLFVLIGHLLNPRTDYETRCLKMYKKVFYANQNSYMNI